jgi:leader peptidase (prepilin peptidase) / N-methyltransferase
MYLALYTWRMAPVLIFILALIVTLGGAWWTRRLPHYEQARRVLPHRTLITVIIAAVTTGVALWQSPTWQIGAWLSLWSVLFTLIAVVDYETHFIPNALIVPAIILGFVASWSIALPPLPSALVGAIVGGIFFGILYLLGGRLYKGGLGFGDVTLSVFIGVVTGVQVVLYSLIAGMLLGGLTLVTLLALKKITMRTFVPYGPFLCLGGWLGVLPAVQQFWS